MFKSKSNYGLIHYDFEYDNVFYDDESKSCNVIDTEHSRKVDVKSQFNIASIRKTYLGFAISLALFEGRIKGLNDSVSVYLDGLDDDVIAGTTIRHLLTHTQGLYSPLKRMFPSGSDWKYNNAGEANLFVSTRELAFWGYLHLTKGYYQGKQILSNLIFEQAVKIITPSALDVTLPRNAFFWWVQDRPRATSELGEHLPKGAFQSLGIYGNALLVIPEYNVVAVRMLNQTERSPSGYDYLRDIQTFGNMVSECILAR